MPRYVGPPPGVVQEVSPPPAPQGAPYGMGQPQSQHPQGPVDRPVNTLDEINFWARQLSEHALFMQLGLVDPRLQATAGALHRSWEQYRPRWAKMDPSQAAQAASECRYMAAELRSFKTMVLDRLNRGEWLGWLFPLFIDHTKRELDLFVSRINGQAEGRREACEWLRFMAEHAAFAAHLLDPQERVLIEAALARMGNFEQLQGACANATMQNLLVLSRQAGADLDEYFQRSGIGTPRVKSVIHPVLAQHVVREGQRFVHVVDALSAAGVQV